MMSQAIYVHPVRRQHLSRARCDHYITAPAATPSKPSLLSRFSERKNFTHGKAQPTVAITAPLPVATKNSVLRRGKPWSWNQPQPRGGDQRATPSSADQWEDVGKVETTSSPAPATPSSGGTGGNKRQREDSPGSDAAAEKKVRSSSRLNRQPPGSAASSSKDKGKAGSNSMTDYVQRRPLFSRTSRPGKDVAFTSGQQPKVTEFDWELFDLYPENDKALMAVAAALPRNFLLSDFWVHQKYEHNLQNRYEHHKADFTKSNDPRLERIACGRAAKLYDKDHKMFRFVVDAKYQLHGEEGRSQGLRTRSEVDDGPGERCSSQEDVVPDSKVVLPPANKSDAWWMGLTRAGAKSEKTKASKGGKKVEPQDYDDEDVVTECESTLW